MRSITEHPKISVVMATFNAQAYLREAIESVLGQTFKDFEFIIVNDGSTDSSVEIINSYTDTRIKLINKKKNSGIVDSLNLGIKMAKGKFIARMDADDISFSGRLWKQLEFLNANPSIGLVGTTMQILYEDGNLGAVDAVLTEDEDIRKALLVTNMIVHGSVLIRKSVLDQVGMYKKKAQHVEDYDLWVRLIKVTKLANLPELLYYWRVNKNGLSHKNSTVQTETAEKIRQEIWNSMDSTRNLPAPSINQTLKRKEFYIHRADPYKKGRLVTMSSVSSKYARKLWYLGFKKAALREFISAVLIRPTKISGYLFILSLIIGEERSYKLEYILVRIKMRVLRTAA